jgi:catechol 2,3-dioxygenase
MKEMRRVKIESLGHVVIKVRDLKVAEQFYNQVLGISIQSRSEAEQMIFFTLGQHHDFAVIAIGAEAAPPNPDAVGTHHIAFKVGGIDDLREAKARLEAVGVTVAPVDHHVTKSLYFSDPDGNALEIYAEGSDDWKSDPDLLFAPVRKLSL